MNMKSCKNFKLIDMSGLKAIDMHNNGLWVEDLHIPSVTPEHLTETVDDEDGLIYLSTRLTERAISAVLQFEVPDGLNITEYNRKLSGLFNPFETYRLVADEDPSIAYQVRVSSGYEIDEMSWEDGKFEIQFIMFKPLRESANLIVRTFRSASFDFYNEGNRTVDMRKQEETEIVFKGDSNGLRIQNLSTGEEWSYAGSTGANDTIILKGVRSLKNGTSIFGQTNKRLLSMIPGNNKFTVSGTSGDFEITIRTRFYFL